MPEPRECRECGEQLWSCGEDPICEGCEMHARGYDAGCRNALREASVADLVAELGRRAAPGSPPTEADVARLVASQEERLRALEALMAGATALAREAAELLSDTVVREVSEMHDTSVSVRRAVVLGRHVGAVDVRRWSERVGALLNSGRQ